MVLIHDAGSAAALISFEHLVFRAKRINGPSNIKTKLATPIRCTCFNWNVSFQGMLVRHRVDVREWVLSTIKASSSPSQAAERMGDSSAQHTSLHPSLLRVVCLYAAACVAPVAMGPSLGSSARPQPFVMAPIVPTEITEIVHAIDWVRQTRKLIKRGPDRVAELTRPPYARTVCRSG